MLQVAYSCDRSGKRPNEDGMPVGMRRPGVPASPAFEWLNPASPPEASTASVDELPCVRSAMSQEEASREVYLLLKEDIKVSVPDCERGGQKVERLRVIDWVDQLGQASLSSRPTILKVSDFSDRAVAPAQTEQPVPEQSNSA